VSVNIIVLVHNRPRLTRQTLDTLVKNTTVPYNVIIVDDASDSETQAVIAEFVRPNIRFIRFNEPVGIIGALRNAGANSSEWTFGRGDWLYFSDNDVAFEPQWLERMIRCFGDGPHMQFLGGSVAAFPNLCVLGGYRHPFHGVNGLDVFEDKAQVEFTDAVAGYSMLMPWTIWDKYGPFDANQKGVGASEDFALCQRIVKDGGKVGYIHPPVLTHTGVTNSNGVYHCSVSSSLRMG